MNYFAFALLPLIPLAYWLGRKSAIGLVRQAQIKVAREAAHDIRSPLTVFKMIIPDVKKISPEVGEMYVKAVTRMEAIASELSAKYPKS